MGILIKISANPYRVFFLFAWVTAIVASFSWAGFWFGLIEYPLYLHRFLFAHGMFIYFISGFLLTAVPQVLKCKKPDSVEISYLISLSIVHLFSFFVDQNYHLLTAILILLGVLVFVLRRIRSFLGTHFIVMPLALISGISALLMIYLHPLNPFYYSLYKDLYFIGFILSMILGVGSFLVVKILGRKERSFNWINTCLIVSFYLGLNLKGDFPDVFRIILSYPYLVYICFVVLQIHKLPGKNTPVGKMLYLSLWILVLGLAGTALDFGYASDLHHLLYLGAFLMITFNIAARVIAAHSDNGVSVPEFESGRKIYYIFTFFFLFASLTRSTVFLLSGDNIGQIVINHYFYAAAFILMGIFVWGGTFIPMIISDLKGDFSGYFGKN